MITDKKLIEEYLDFVNNYLTVSLFSEHRQITKEQGTILIKLGKELYEKTI